jgi:hypothetical protein
MYLGTVLANKNELRPVIKKIIANANRTYCVLLPLLKSQSLPRAEKIKICETLLRPVATYGAESWSLNKGIAEWLAAFKEKF